MKGKIGYLFYDDEGSRPDLWAYIPDYKKYQGKWIKIVYFEVEDDS